MNKGLIYGIVFLGLLGAAQSVEARLITLEASGLGSYSRGLGIRDVTFTPGFYSAGFRAPGITQQVRVSTVNRNAALFNLAPVAGETILSATVQIDLPDIFTYFSAEPFETLALYDTRTTLEPWPVLGGGTTSVSLTNNACNGSLSPNMRLQVCVDTWEDLGSGNVYGEVDVTADDTGTEISIALNDIALADMQPGGVAGGLWGFGGAMFNGLALGDMVTRTGGSPSRFILGGRFDTADVRLLLDIETEQGPGFPFPDPPPPEPVSEPAALPLLALGMLGIFICRRRNGYACRRWVDRAA